MMRTTKSAGCITILIVGFALAGAWASGSLLVGHDGGWRAADADNWLLWGLCGSVSLPSASCAEVVGSRWGSFDIVVGSRSHLIPTSFVGLAYFVTVAIWFTVVSPISGASRWLRRLTLFTLLCGFAGSVFFVVVMASDLSIWCPLCLVAHGFNAAVLLSAVWCWRRVRLAESQGETVVAVRAETPGSWSQIRRVCTAGITALSVTVGLWLYYDAAREARRQWRKVDAFERMIASMQSDPEFMLREYYAQPIVDLSQTKRSDGIMSSEGVVGMTVFGNFDCSPCNCFDSRWRHGFGAAFGSKVNVDYRYAPGDGASVSEDRTAALTGAHPARRAAEAARMQGGDRAYLAMHRLLFKHRKDPGGRDYVELAGQAGLEVQRFKTDMQGDATLRAVEEDIVLAERLGVTATPTVFLDGRKVPELCLKSRAFWMAIAADLGGQTGVGSLRTGSGSEALAAAPGD